MKDTWLKRGILTAAVLLLAGTVSFCSKGTLAAEEELQLYAGSTHAHSQFTWSHGAQFAKPAKGAPRKPGMEIKGGVSYPAPHMTPREDWQEVQGPPAEHYARAKAAGYDFYAVTDHSQEATFHPTSSDNPAWGASKQQAREATDGEFVALAGYEHSENDGPGAKGHINVFNSAAYLNALEPKVDLPGFYSWLKTAAADGEGPVVASFNHPGGDQYDNWAHRDAEITEIITLLEVINSSKARHEQAFVKALDKGWKVSPVAGNDNHGFWGIAEHDARTFVLAASKSKADILEAMKQRRTYASLDKNLRCRYSVNGAVMGSTLERPDSLRFDITVEDPDASDASDKITRIDLVTDGGEVAKSYRPTPAHRVSWNPSITVAGNKYFFVRVWSADDEDGDGQPVAWLAPVWTGR